MDDTPVELDPQGPITTWVVRLGSVTYRAPAARVKDFMRAVRALDGQPGWVAIGLSFVYVAGTVVVSPAQVDPSSQPHADITFDANTGFVDADEVLGAFLGRGE